MENEMLEVAETVAEGVELNVPAIALGIVAAGLAVVAGALAFEIVRFKESQLTYKSDETGEQVSAGKIADLFKMKGGLSLGLK